MTPLIHPARHDADIIIIGAGLAGACAATVLSSAGLKVALVEMRAVHPPEFRAEKFGDVHMSLFEKLGLAPAMQPFLTPMNDAWVYRYGQPFAHQQTLEYGFAYGALVNGLRAALPAAVHLIIGKVAQVETSPDQQKVTLSDGSVLSGRLVAVATGLGETIRRSLGIERVLTSRQHSMSLGFNLARPAGDYPFETLTYYGSDPAKRMAYLTLFPVGKVMRGNLFVYRNTSEDWTRQFRQEAPAMMGALMPQIRSICADYALDGHVEVRTIDLNHSRNFVQDGVVLLGDAFASTCPVPGVGVSRAMSDVAQLANVHLPRWLATPGMGKAKIAEFYADPVKQAVDGHAMESSQYSRLMATEPGLAWSARRLRNAVVRRGYAMARTVFGIDPGEPPFEPASMSGPGRSEASRAA